jgi:hypothetical protein
MGKCISGIVKDCPRLLSRLMPSFLVKGSSPGSSILFTLLFSCFVSKLRLYSDGFHNPTSLDFFPTDRYIHIEASIHAGSTDQDPSRAEG